MQTSADEEVLIHLLSDTGWFIANVNAYLRQKVTANWEECRRIEKGVADFVEAWETEFNNSLHHPPHPIAEVPTVDLSSPASRGFVSLPPQVAKELRHRSTALKERWHTLLEGNREGSLHEDIEMVHRTFSQCCSFIAPVLQPEQSDPLKSAADALPEYPNRGFYEFDVADSPLNIRFSQEDPTLASAGQGVGPQIKCATLIKLIERLTHEKYQDLNIRYAFLLTYRSFSDPEAMLDLLIHRYYVPIPPNMTPREVECFKKKKQAAIQIKVFSVLDYWLKQHFYDFQGDPALKKKMVECLDQMTKFQHGPWTAKSAPQMLQLIKRKERENEEEFSLQPRPNLTSALKHPELYQLDYLRRHGVFEIPVKEVARHLTLIDWENFKQIAPRECLNQGWTKKDKHVRAPHIVKISSRFNQISKWVSTEILRQEETSKRVLAIKYFIKLAQELYKLHNYNSLYGIFAGLSVTPVYRLRSHWSKISSRKIEFFEQIRDLVSLKDNQKRLREDLKTAAATSSAPCIPYLGLFLGDLYFIEDGNPDEMNGMINFFKRRKIAQVIENIITFQRGRFDFEENAQLRSYLLNLEFKEEDALYQLSYAIEERGK